MPCKILQWVMSFLKYIWATPTHNKMFVQVNAQLDEAGHLQLHDIACLWCWLRPQLQAEFPSQTVDHYTDLFMKGHLAQTLRRIGLGTKLAGFQNTTWIWPKGLDFCEWFLYMGLAGAKWILDFVIGSWNTPSQHGTYIWPAPSGFEILWFVPIKHRHIIEHGFGRRQIGFVLADLYQKNQIKIWLDFFWLQKKTKNNHRGHTFFGHKFWLWKKNTVIFMNGSGGFNHKVK